MKRFITSLIAAALLIAALPASATSYSGYARNWWVQENGDITYYLLNADNSAWVNGMCGSPLYVLQTGKTNFDEVYSSLMLASKNGYRVIMEVTACSSNINIIKMVKVCTWTGDC